MRKRTRMMMSQGEVHMLSKVLWSFPRRGGWASMVGAGAIGSSLLLLFILHSRKQSPKVAPPKDDDGDHHKNQDVDQVVVPGLHNIGNSCFLNAIVQALASSKEFCSYVVSHGRESCAISFCSMPLAEALSNLLKELSVLAKDPHVSSPRRVILALENYTDHFDFAAQQDAAEALAHLTTALQEERLSFYDYCRDYIQSLVDVSNSVVGGSLGLNIFRRGGDGDEHEALQLWRRQLHSPIEGTMGSLLTCQMCGFQFTTQFQFFHDIPLSPQHTMEGIIVEGCTLYDCLEQFMALESIANFKCSHCAHLCARDILTGQSEASEGLIRKIMECNCDDDCCCKDLLTERGVSWKDAYSHVSKQLRIARSPEVICLQIQRAVISETGELMKVMGHVSFPLVLNLYAYTMSAYMHPQAGHSGRNLSENLTNYSAFASYMQGGTFPSTFYTQYESLNSNPFVSRKLKAAYPLQTSIDPFHCFKSELKNKEFLYELISVVVHHGGPRSGHYTVYRKVKLTKSTSSQTFSCNFPFKEETCSIREEEALETSIRKCESNKDPYENMCTDQKDMHFEKGSYSSSKPSEEDQESIEIWFRVSDSRVKRVPVNEVLMAEATLLFYERCDRIRT